MYNRPITVKFQSIGSAGIIADIGDGKTEEFVKKEALLTQLTKDLHDYSSKAKNLTILIDSYTKECESSSKVIDKLRKEIDALNELIKEKKKQNDQIIEEANKKFHKQLSLLLIKQVLLFKLNSQKKP